ncbi:MAG: hypothetical protein ABSF43_17125 [Rectinemataceae bacterium]|jgi:hypothetical protein
MDTEKHRERWEAIIMKWKGSGKTQKVFCQEKKISYWSFRNWKKKGESQPESEAKIGIVEILSAPESSPPSQEIPIRIVFPSGITIEPGTKFDERDIVAIIRAVRCV